MAPCTPRTWRRFFRPREQQLPSREIMADRSALVDLNRSSLNQRRPHVPQKPSTGDVEELLELGSPTPLAKKRPRNDDGPAGPLIMPKKQKLSNGDVHILSSPMSLGRSREPSPAPIRPSKVRQSLGRFLYREIGTSLESRRECFDDVAPWTPQAADFLSDPDDRHTCNNIGNSLAGLTIPFCIAACHTNTLVAVGDEEGDVRLLETDRAGKPAFSSALLTFRPHANAVLDLAFSSDDMLLATAFGDKTAQIIDMPTQRARCKLVGHHSSVKEIKFQPGSGDNVIATSGRDGSIRIWDLRCKGTRGPVAGFEVSFDAADGRPSARSAQPSSELYAACVNTIPNAHKPSPGLGKGPATSQKPRLRSGSSTAAAGARADISVTALSFLSASRPHFLLSGSEACATVQLWDLRLHHAQRANRAVPLSVARPPAGHHRHRQYGLTSLALGADGARLYALCRDSTAYVYATSHLVLGSCPQWDAAAARPRRGEPRTGLGPLYGLRHAKLKVPSFYVKLAVRPAVADRAELLAVGSGSSCPVIFSTDERFRSRTHDVPNAPLEMDRSPKASSPGRKRVDVEDVSRSSGKLPIYRGGMPMVGGHDKETTDLTWTSEGSLITVSDDLTCRLWREDRDGARARRLQARGGQQCNFGKADLEGWENWDDSE